MPATTRIAAFELAEHGDDRVERGICALHLIHVVDEADTERSRGSAVTEPRCSTSTAGRNLTARSPNRDANRAVIDPLAQRIDS